MNPIARARVTVPLMMLAAACCAARAAETGGTGAQVTMDGSSISTDVRMVGGRPYVALGDVAKALNMRVVRSGGEYRLVRPGGAGRLSAAAGKLGAAVRSGAWSLRVVSIEQVAGYALRFGSESQPVAPRVPGDVLFLVKCQLRNASGETQNVYFDRNNAGNTALTDDQSHSYTPVAFDSRNDNYATSRMLPGSAHEFSVLFSVPGDTNVRDLIYTVNSSDMEAKTDFRVSLKP